MTRTHRPFSRYVAFALVVLLMPVFAFATAVAATGTVTVSVQERGVDGMRLYLPVPALLVDLVVFVAPRIIPDDALAEVREEIAPFRAGLDELVEEIASCPQGVLVDVQNDNEHIRISKGWRSFSIEVDSNDADIRVSVPARLASRVMDVL